MAGATLAVRISPGMAALVSGPGRHGNTIMKISTNPRRGMRRAFTLIELLVVVAIIAMLAAILFPVFGTVREKARQSACLSNMKQLGLAIMQYEQDCDGTLPRGVSNNSNNTGWGGTIYPYVQDEQVFLCPDDTGQAEVNNPTAYGTSYCINGNLFNTGTHSGVIESTLKVPDRTLLLCEVINNGGYNLDLEYAHTVSDSPSGIGKGANDPDGNGGCATGFAPCPAGSLRYDTGYFQNAAAIYGYNAPTGRHSGGSVFLLCDGHAKWMLAQNVSAGANNPTDAQCGMPWGVNYAAASVDCNSGGVQATFSIE